MARPPLQLPTDPASPNPRETVYRRVLRTVVGHLLAAGHTSLARTREDVRLLGTFETVMHDLNAVGVVACPHGNGVPCHLAATPADLLAAYATLSERDREQAATRPADNAAT